MRNYELQEKFITNNETNLDLLSNQIRIGLENIEAFNDSLIEYSSKIGTTQDTKIFRNKMRDKITQASDEIKKVFGALESLESLKLTTANDRDNRNRMVKRMLEKFDSAKARFQAVVKKITTSEKAFIENARKSTYGRESYGFGEPIAMDNKGDFVFQEQQIQEVNITEEIINEREKDVTKFQEVITLMNDISKKQAEAVKFQGEQLEMVVGNLQSSKGNMVQANKNLTQTVERQDSTNRGNMYACFIIAIICAVLVMIYMAQSQQCITAVQVQN